MVDGPNGFGDGDGQPERIDRDQSTPQDQTRSGPDDTNRDKTRDLGHPDAPLPSKSGGPAPDAAPRAKPSRKRAARAATRPSERKPVFQAHGLSHFLSTSRIPRNLEALVGKSFETNARLDHILIHGAPGSGTALLAGALIRDYAPRKTVEVDAALGCDSEFLQRAIDDVGTRGVLFVRHIDALDPHTEQFLVDTISGRVARPRRRPRAAPIDPTELDYSSAGEESGSRAGSGSRGATPPDFTLVATAHFMPQVGYLLRTSFDHLFHLRDDPKALRNAIVRTLCRGRSVSFDLAAFHQLELVLKSLWDAAEPILRSIELRIATDGVTRIDAETMRSVLEEDLADRLPNEAYSHALRRHLAGRKIEQSSEEEVARIARETGWGTAASEAAIATMLHEDTRRRSA